MVNFYDLISDETKADLAEFEKRKAEYANLTNDNFIATAKYSMGQCREPAMWGKGECVYNATVWHLLMPEAFRRIERLEAENKRLKTMKGKTDETN